MNPARTIYGLPIMTSVIAVETVPVRKHEPKGRGAYLHRTCYCRRVQKKWVKRFGTQTVPAMFVIGGHTVVMHPTLLYKLEAERIA